MAKKSAASKGYRKVAKKKPFLSKKEIIALAVIAAIVVIAFIVVNLVSTAGLIRQSKIQSGDIITVTKTNDYYKKLGTINEVEGYTMQAFTSSESPTGGYNFAPVDEASPLKQFHVGGAINNASSMASTSHTYMSSMGLDKVSDIQSATIGGREAYVLCGTRTDSTKESPCYQLIYAYTDVDGTYSISMSATIEGDSEDIYVADADLGAYMDQFSAAFTIAE